MEDFFLVLQIVTSIILTVFILVQAKGTGLGRSWGSSASFSRRGLERVIFRGTFILGFVFVSISLFRLFA